MTFTKLAIIATIMVISGCAGNSGVIKANSNSLRSDVFIEAGKAEAPTDKSAVLSINGSFKTHLPGKFSSSDVHGTSDLKLLLNIDGQAMNIPAKLQREDKSSAKIDDPEAGDGMKYNYGISLRLNPGIHKILLAVENEDVVVEKQISLKENSSNTIAFEPVYSTKPGKRTIGKYSITNFEEGIRALELKLNGNEL